jgi:hypothetical protein
MTAEGSSETLILICQTTRRHITEGCAHIVRCRDNLKSHNEVQCIVVLESCVQFVPTVNHNNFINYKGIETVIHSGKSTHFELNKDRL